MVYSRGEIVKAFLSTPSARRATPRPICTARTTSISIHALREEGDGGLQLGRDRQGISIHALREEGDLIGWAKLPIRYQISIHALREEGDAAFNDERMMYVLFLSTPSARRATCPCKRPGSACAISIHALREEGDSVRRGLRNSWSYFYPRPPRGGRPS